jgi:hypothetical protein
MEPEDLLTYSQEPVTAQNFEADESSPHHHQSSPSPPFII